MEKSLLVITRTSKIFYPFLLLTAGIVIPLLYFFVFPLYQQYFPKCLFHEVTGLYCPGCGSQRAFVALLNEDIVTALHDNALATLLLPFLLYVAAMFFLNTFREKRIYTKVFNSFLSPRFILILVIVFFILRNISVYPFTILAPVN
jgi:hypothetical protein